MAIEKMGKAAAFAAAASSAATKAEIKALTNAEAERSSGWQLPSGHSLQVERATSTIRVSNPEGRVELTVRCTAEGCVLDFASAEVTLSAPGKLSLHCAELEVQTTQRLELSTDGNFASRVAGNSVTVVTGRSETRADELSLAATGGDATFYANDYVRVNGEKILLNSEHEGRGTRDQIETFWRMIGL
jgi:6-phosphofructokinase